MTVNELMELLKREDGEMKIMQSNDLFMWRVSGLSKQYCEELDEEVIVID